MDQETMRRISVQLTEKLIQRPTIEQIKHIRGYRPPKPYNSKLEVKSYFTKTKHLVLISKTTF